MYVDLSFHLQAVAPIPVDHGYLLYSALSRVLPELHEPNGLAVHPITGRQIGNRELSLMRWSRLTIRTAADRIAPLLKLAGQPLDLAGRKLRVGVPQVLPLQPAAALRSRLVTIKLKESFAPDAFRNALRRKLDLLQVSQKVAIILGNNERRRTIRIKDKEVVGYEVVLKSLEAEESLMLQENCPPDPALCFSRSHMGCGVFVPAKGEEG